MTLTAEERRAAGDLVHRALEHAVREGGVLPVDEGACPDGLRQPQACFVTLRNPDGSLRGCIGSLAPRAPLAVELSRAAHNAALRDPRFPAVEAQELGALEVHVAVLSPSEPLAVTDEEEAIAGLRPGIDGVILSDRGRRATFLPEVWNTLPEPRAFLAQLKRKAGLPADHWSDDTTLEVYTVESLHVP